MALPEIIINGNATRDAVAGTSKDGRRYLFVTVAQNKSRKREDGTWAVSYTHLTLPTSDLV